MNMQQWAQKFGAVGKTWKQAGGYDCFGDPKGACAGVAAVWLANRRKGIDFRDHIGTDVAQADVVWIMQQNRTTEAGVEWHMLQKGGMVGPEKIVHENHNPTHTATLVAERNGYYYLALTSLDLNKPPQKEDGHSLALFHTDDEIGFFDPNNGSATWPAEEKNKFAEAFSSFCSEKYASLSGIGYLQRYLGVL
jgi:hypothetical protein